MESAAQTEGGVSDMSVQSLKFLVQKQFSEHAHEYITSTSHADPDALAALVTQLDPQRQWIVLDVATGGHVAKTLAPHVRHVVASDLTATMLGTARNHLSAVGVENISYVLADAEQLPFLESSFDAVTCRIAAHHFPNPSQFVAETSRVLQPNGKFLLVDNIVPEDGALGLAFNEMEKLRDASHVHCATVKQWKGWLSAAGLRLCFEQERRKTFSFLSWMQRMANSEAHVEQVERWLLATSAAFQAYFRVSIVAGRVQSL